MATIQNITDFVDGLKPNAYTTAQKIAWVNDVDYYVKENILKVFLNNTVQRVADQAAYTMPNGLDFNDIEYILACDMLIDGRYHAFKALRKIDLRSHSEEGYWYDNSKINVYPTPTVTDDASNPGLIIVSRQQLTPHTLAADSVLLPDKWMDAYTNYIFAQIDFYNKDYDDYNNSLVRYNNTMKDVENWYKKNDAIDKNAKITNVW